MKKKIFLALLTLVLALPNYNCINVSAKQKNNNQNTQNEVNSKHQNLPNLPDLNDYVVDGDGSANDPYLLSESCPYIPVLESVAAKEMEEMQSEDNTSINTGFKTNYLSGIGTHMVLLSIGQQNTYTSNHYKEHTYQTSGGYYVGSKAPSVNSNGVCWVRGMEYIPYTDVNYACKLYNYTSALNKAVSKIKKGVNAAGAYQTVIAAYPSIAATTPGLAKALGGTAFAKATIAIAILDYVNGVLKADKSLYSKAKDQQKGILKVSYSVSYNGSWYECPTACDCIWSSYPTVFEPNSYYGTGSYKSNYLNSPSMEK